MHTGHVRSARRDASASVPLGSVSTYERAVGWGWFRALPPFRWRCSRGRGTGSSATAERRSAIAASSRIHGEVAVDRVAPRWNCK